MIHSSGAGGGLQSQCKNIDQLLDALHFPKRSGSAFVLQCLGEVVLQNARFLSLASLSRNTLMVAKIKTAPRLKRDSVHEGCHTPFSLDDEDGEWMDGLMYFIISPRVQMMKQLLKRYCAYLTLLEAFCWL